MKFPIQLFFVSNHAGELGNAMVHYDYRRREPDSPRNLPDGTPIAYLNITDKTDHHQTMGEFVAAWARVENAMSLLFAVSTGIPFAAVRLFMNNQNNQALYKTLQAMGVATLTDETAIKRYNAILDRFKESNTRRNRIIHGQWALDIRLYDWNGSLGNKTRLIIWYDDGMPDTRRKLSEGDPNVLANFIFDEARIKQLTKGLHELDWDITLLSAEMEGRDPNQPVMRAIGL